VQHDRDLLRLSNLRVVEYLREHADMRRRLCDMFRPGVVRSRFDLSGDVYMSGLDDLS
jgi:hypothetical protein